MRIFPHPNKTCKDKCPICNTLEDKPVVLVGISGTEEDNIMKAVQIHVNCLELTYHEDKGVILQVII